MDAIGDMSTGMGVVFTILGFGGFFVVWRLGWFWPWILVVGVFGLMNLASSIPRARRRKAGRIERAKRRRERERRRE